MTYEVTLTDAIHDGESWTANGSIVHRHTIDVCDKEADRQLWMRARETFGYSGVRGRYISDDAWMPYRSTMMIYITEQY